MCPTIINNRFLFFIFFVCHIGCVEFFNNKTNKQITFPTHAFLFFV